MGPGDAILAIYGPNVAITIEQQFHDFNIEPDGSGI